MGNVTFAHDCLAGQLFDFSKNATSTKIKFFSDKSQNYIKVNIKADLDGASEGMVNAMLCENGLFYS
jgi:hypothetical protein